MEDDPQLRELTAHPKHRRVLITDMRCARDRPLIEALQKAGAAHVFVGEAEAGGAARSARGSLRWTGCRWCRSM
jgi:hypothetical protein